MASLNKILKLDMFSSPYQLNMAGDSGSKSYGGVLLTLLYSSLMAAVGFSNIKSYFDSTNPIEVSETFTKVVYPKIDLLENKVSPILIAYSDETTFIKAEEVHNYFTYVIQKISWVSTVVNGEPKFQKNFEIFPTVPCSQLTQEESFGYSYIDKGNYLYESIQDYGLCGKLPKNLTVEGKGADSLFTLLSVKLLPCSAGASCKSSQEMTKANFQLIVPSLDYNASNYLQPIKYITNVDDVFYVHPLYKQIFTAKMINRTVTDQEGIIPTLVERVTAYGIDKTVLTLQYRDGAVNCTAAQAAVPDNPQCLPYFEYNIQSSGTVTLNKRAYPTPSDIMGTIGGTSRVIFVGLVIAYFPFSRRNKKNSVMQKIFPLIFDEQFSTKKSKNSQVIPSTPDKEAAEQNLLLQGDDQTKKDLVPSSELNTGKEVAIPKELESKKKAISQKELITGKGSPTENSSNVLSPDSNSNEAPKPKDTLKSPNLIEATGVKSTVIGKDGKPALDLDLDKFSLKFDDNLGDAFGKLADSSKIKNDVENRVTRCKNRIVECWDKTCKKIKNTKLGRCCTFFADKISKCNSKVVAFVTCQKKKSSEQIEREEKVTKTFSKITEALDVVTIVRNFNLLNVVAHVILEDRHRDLAQMIGFKLWKAEQAERDEVEKKLNLKDLGDNAREEMLVKYEKAKTNESIKQVKTGYAKSLNNKEWAEKLRYLADQFYENELSKAEAPDPDAKEGEEENPQGADGDNKKASSPKGGFGFGFSWLSEKFNKFKEQPSSYLASKVEGLKKGAEEKADHLKGRFDNLSDKAETAKQAVKDRAGLLDSPVKGHASAIDSLAQGAKGQLGQMQAGAGRLTSQAGAAKTDVEDRVGDLMKPALGLKSAHKVGESLDIAASWELSPLEKLRPLGGNIDRNAGKDLDNQVMSPANLLKGPKNI